LCRGFTLFSHVLFTTFTTFIIFYSGKAFLPSFQFDGSILPETTVDTMPNLTAVTFPYNHLYFESSTGQIKAMNEVFDIVDKYKTKIDPTEGQLFAHAVLYSTSITTEVVMSELFKNIALSLVCIFLVTFLLLTNFVASLMVLLTVVLTLIDCAGLMHFWGLSVEPITAVLLQVIFFTERYF
jgi:Niemann-Pick C1 protein